MDNSKSLAELAAMKARGELTQDQYDEAKRLLQPAPVSMPSPAPSIVNSPIPPKKLSGGAIALWVVVGMAALYATSLLQDSQGTAKSQVGASEAEKRRQGFHCLSAWDGSNRALVYAVERQLRDPGSFEHVETRIAPAESGHHAVVMTYRAKNGFGGTNVETAIGKIRQSNCELVSWRTE